MWAHLRRRTVSTGSVLLKPLAAIFSGVSRLLQDARIVRDFTFSVMFSNVISHYASVSR